MLEQNRMCWYVEGKSARGSKQHMVITKIIVVTLCVGF